MADSSEPPHSMLLRLIAAWRGRPTTWGTVVSWMAGRTGRVLSLTIPFFIAAWYGATGTTDVFFFTYAIVVYVAALFSPMQERIMAPYVEEARTEGRDVGELVGQVIGVTGVATVGVFVAAAILGRPFLSLLTAFSTDQVRLAYGLLFELGLVALFTVWSSVLSVTLRVCGHTGVVYMAQFAQPITMLVSMASLYSISGIHAVAHGYLLAETLRLTVLLTGLIRSRVCKLRFSSRYDTRVRQYFRTTLYMTIGSASVGLNPIVDMAMASWLDEGNMSLLNYAQSLYAIPLALITSRVIVAVLAPWRKHYQEGGVGKLTRDIEKIVFIVIILSIAITCVLVLLHIPIIRVLLGWGAIDANERRTVAMLFLCYMAGFVPFMIGRVYVQAHQVIQSFPVFGMLGTLNFVLNVMFNLILIPVLGVYGIAIGTGAVSCVVTVLLVRAFHRQCAAARQSQPS